MVAKTLTFKESNYKYMVDIICNDRCQSNSPWLSHLLSGGNQRAQLNISSHTEKGLSLIKIGETIESDIKERSTV